MTKILSPLQNNFLVEFFHLTQYFYLPGGTALIACYLHNRYSVDIDLVTFDHIAFQMADKFTEQMCSKLKIAGIPVRITPVFKHFQLDSTDNPLTVHFALESVPQIKPTESFESILVDTIEDITANKICTALGRTAIKDIIDLYFLDKAGYSITHYFKLAQQKDAGLTSESLAYTLSQFEFTEIPNFVLKPLKIAELKQFIESTIKWLINKSTPPSKY